MLQARSTQIGFVTDILMTNRRSSVRQVRLKSIVECEHASPPQQRECCLVNILGLSETRWWDPGKYSALSFGNVLFYSQKPSITRHEVCVGLILTATARLS